MFSTLGIMYFIIAQLIFLDKRIRNVELDLPDAVTSEENSIEGENGV